MRYSLTITLGALTFVTQAVNTSVSTDCNRYSGVSLSNGISQWLGIRYAEAPVGNLRFAPPQSLPCKDDVQTATEHGPICLSTGGSPNATGHSEDCLFLDIYAPSNATQQSKLPVFFYMQGGGMNENASPNLNGTGLITASGYSIIVVTIGYRVGPYGFLTNGDLITPNNGLRDQIKAMEWVQEHISQFGGNPKHVVLGGDSAGAGSVSLHLASNNGNGTNLFHAAAIESVSFPPVLTVEESQYQYDGLAIRMGCLGSSLDTLACLRSKTAAEIQAENYGMPYPGGTSPPLYMYNPVMENDLVRDYTSNVYANGNFMKIPLLSGDDTNGGTIFAPSSTSTLAESNMFLKNQFPKLTLEQLARINELFPNPNRTCPNRGCYWRHAANQYGDLRYMCPNLFVASAFTQYGVKSNYNYRYNVEDPVLVAAGKGVPHVSEMSPLFGPENVNGQSPLSYWPNGTNAMVVPVMQAYWTSFIRSFDPNKYRYPGSARWESFDTQNQSRLLFKTGGSTEMEAVDGDMRNRCSYLQGIGVDILQ